MNKKNLKSLLQTKQKTISRDTGYPSQSSGRDGDFQVRRIPGQGIFLFYKWYSKWYSSRLTQYRPRTAEHKEPVRLPVGVKPIKEGDISINNGNVSIGKSGNKTNTIISIDKDNLADVSTPAFFKRADTTDMGTEEAKDPTFLIENTGHAHLRFYSPSNVYDQFLSFGRRHPETFSTSAWCVGLDSSTNIFRIMYRPVTGDVNSNHDAVSTITPSAGDTYEQLSVTSNGVLRIGLIQNASTDTDKFLVSDNTNNGYVKYRTGANVLSDIGALKFDDSIIAPAVITATASIASGTRCIKLSHTSTPILITGPDGVRLKGQTMFITNVSASGTAAHTVTLASGTFDGTNNKATLNAPGETLHVWFDTAGSGCIIANVGSVALSSV